MNNAAPRTTIQGLLADARTAADLTQSELASLRGLSRSAQSDTEAATSNPSWSTISDIVDHLGGCMISSVELPNGNIVAGVVAGRPIETVRRIWGTDQIAAADRIARAVAPDPFDPTASVLAYLLRQLDVSFHWSGEPEDSLGQQDPLDIGSLVRLASAVVTGHGGLVDGDFSMWAEAGRPCAEAVRQLGEQSSDREVISQWLDRLNLRGAR